MFEQIDGSVQKDAELEKDPITLAEGLGIYLMVLTIGAVSLCAFIKLGDRPYGIQFATLISYSCFVFLYTFFRTKGINTRHRLGDSYVQQQLPRLFMIHCAYLLGIFLLDTWALSERSLLPKWWLTSSGKKNMPPFVFASMISIGLIAVTQIILSRRILGRARQKFLSGSTEIA